MAIENVVGGKSSAATMPGMVAAASRQLARMWCGMHGHFSLLHFEPNRLSLQCGLCGYQSEGWELGLPPGHRTAGQRVDNHHARVERRRTVRALASSAARMAS